MNLIKQTLEENLITYSLMVTSIHLLDIYDMYTSLLVIPGLENLIGHSSEVLCDREEFKT